MILAGNWSTLWINQELSHLIIYLLLLLLIIIMTIINSNIIINKFYDMHHLNRLLNNEKVKNNK